jgi:hypothetical protein
MQIVLQKEQITECAGTRSIWKRQPLVTLALERGKFVI